MARNLLAGITLIIEVWKGAGMEVVRQAAKLTDTHLLRALGHPGACGGALPGDAGRLPA